jgi:hypothetical protein
MRKHKRETNWLRLRLRKTNGELSVVKAQLARVSENLAAVTGNYEATKQNYQEAP